MKIRIILENAPDSELDRREITIPDDTSGMATERMSNAIKDVLGEWTLTPGDTIKIQEA
jgi:hypothetical protein